MPYAAPAGYVIRPCQDIQELESCVRLQQQIWGYDPEEVYPLRLFVNLMHIGGQVLGAFTRELRPHLSGAERHVRHDRKNGSGRSGALVGFLAAMPAWRDGKRYLHSLSLGVARRHENRGLGRLMKLAQRELAIKEGIRRIEWTFDPMRAKNAFFNIVRLGAITRSYRQDYYGSVHSRLQQGLPSDRLISEWRLRSSRVRVALEGREPRRPPKPAAEITIPADFASLAERDPAGARAIQRSVRRRFEQCFERSLVVTSFERGDPVGRYILESWHEN